MALLGGSSKARTQMSTQPDTIEARRRRIRFRAWRRGTRELDLLVGPFADRFAPSLSETELELFEALLELPDQDLYRWLVGPDEAPIDYRTSLLTRMIAFNGGRQ